jgi:hypothetical protein
LTSVRQLPHFYKLLNPSSLVLTELRKFNYNPALNIYFFSLYVNLINCFHKSTFRLFFKSGKIIWFKKFKKSNFTINVGLVFRVSFSTVICDKNLLVNHYLRKISTNFWSNILQKNNKNVFIFFKDNCAIFVTSYCCSILTAFYSKLYNFMRSHYIFSNNTLKLFLLKKNKKSSFFFNFYCNLRDNCKYNLINLNAKFL